MPDIPIEFDLGDNGKRHKLPNSAALQKWISDEETFWKFVLTAPTSWHQLHNLVHPMREQFSNLRSFENQLRERENAGNQDPKFGASISSRISDLFNRQSNRSALIYSNTVLGAFLKDLADEDRLVGVFAYFFARGQGGQIQEFYVQQQAAAVRMTLFSIGIKARGTLELNQLKKAQAAWEVRTAELEKEIDELRQVISDYKCNAQAALEEQRENADALHEELKQGLVNSEQEVNEVTAAYGVKLDEITEDYDRRMTVKAPVEYWKAKADRHLSRSYLFAIFSGILSIGGLWILSGVAKAYLNAEKPPFHHITLFLLAATSVLLIIRVAIKLMMSQIHLHQDASERVVQVQTYLAMMQDNPNLVPEETKNLVWASMFRQAATGIVADDSSQSAPLLEMFSKFVQGKSGGS